MRFHGKTLIVTSGGSGMEAATATLPRAIALGVEVPDEGQMRNVMDTAVKEFGSIARSTTPRAEPTTSSR